MDASWCMRRSKDLRSGDPTRFELVTSAFGGQHHSSSTTGQRDQIGRLSKGARRRGQIFVF